MTNYNDGKWHGWNGGECPVHLESIVQVSTPEGWYTERAGNWDWDYKETPISAFRVVKEYREPREVWVNEYLCGIGSAHPCKESADRNASSGRIRCTLFREVV